MFNIYNRSQLHSFGEIVQPWRFWWQTRLDGYAQWDFGARNLRSARWLHRRADVDFNGWFSCLIPRVVLEQIGLSLPLFLKWDDSEFGLRAKEAGFPTVSLPGSGGLARPVDRQERRARLAVLLPPAQPLRRGAAPLAVPEGRADGARVAQPPDQAPGLDAVRHRRAAPPRARGRPGRALRPARPAADQARRGQRLRQAVHRHAAPGRPRRASAGPPREAGQAGQGRRARSPVALAADHRRLWRPSGSSARCGRCRGSSPRRSCRRWTPPGTGSRATTRPWSR